MNQEPLDVAVPWSLTHYIPLNGFHPLYRALFDQLPAAIHLHAWDNVRLHKRLGSDISMRNIMLNAANEAEKELKSSQPESIARSHLEHYWPANKVFTEELTGDIEFHHTAPFPTLKRPFIFHCESFSPIFAPFSQQGSGRFEKYDELREHYRRIFSNPLCLGIYSHIPETLENLRRFFLDASIDQKLFNSRIGLSSKAFKNCENIEKPDVTRPIFLFVNSANQNPLNFFHRGGHIVLRFWKEFKRSGRDGLLILRCTKPSDKDFLDYGVDVSFVGTQTNNEIVWAENYLSNRNLNTLMGKSHFLLLPSASLHSASILHAMKMEAIPIVTDTVGTSVYVKDEVNGIVLKGVKAEIWHEDPDTGVYFDQYSRNPVLDDSLVSQLTSRLTGLLDKAGAYETMKTQLIIRDRDQFSGEKFSVDFWNSVVAIHRQRKDDSYQSVSLKRDVVRYWDDCMLSESDWSRVFESVPQSKKIIFTGKSVVWEMGGALVMAFGNPIMKLHDWSVFGQIIDQTKPKLFFSNTLIDLNLKFLAIGAGRTEGFVGDELTESSIYNKQRNVLVQKIKNIVHNLLRPFPGVDAFVSGILRLIRNNRLYRMRHRQYLSLKNKKSTKGPDIELVVEGVSEYNIIRFFHLFYALPQGQGEFDWEKAISGDGIPSITGTSLDAVICAISSKVCRESPLIADDAAVAESKLLIEGVHGFNIMQVGEQYVAILQSDGAFEHKKLLSQKTSCFFVGRSSTQLRELISARAAFNKAAGI